MLDATFTKINLPFSEIVKQFEFFTIANDVSKLRYRLLGTTGYHDPVVDQCVKIFRLDNSIFESTKCYSCNISADSSIHFVLCAIPKEVFDKCDESIFKFLSIKTTADLSYETVKNIVKFIPDETCSPSSKTFNINKHLQHLYSTLKYIISMSDSGFYIPDVTATVYTIWYCLQNFTFEADNTSILIFSRVCNELLSARNEQYSSLSDEKNDSLESIIIETAKNAKFDNYTEGMRVLFDIEKIYREFE